MFTFFGCRCKLSPEFRGLILIIPFKLRIPRRKISLLRARWVLIAADAGDERIPFVLCHHLLQRDRFQLVRDRDGIMRFVADAASACFLVYPYD